MAVVSPRGPRHKVRNLICETRGGQARGSAVVCAAVTKLVRRALGGKEARCGCLPAAEHLSP